MLLLMLVTWNFLNEHVILVFFKKDKKKKRKVNRAKLTLDVKKNCFLKVIIIHFLSVHIFCSE